MHVTTESLSSEQRHIEIAALLARGVLRLRSRHVQPAESLDKNLSADPKTCLDVPPRSWTDGARG